MISFFRWVFSTSGIQYTSAEPFRITLFGRNLVYFNTLLGVMYKPKGPTAKDATEWLKWKKVLREYRCKFCNTKVWSWRAVKTCGRFNCFRKNGGKWN